MSAQFGQDAEKIQRQIEGLSNPRAGMTQADSAHSNGNSPGSARDAARTKRERIAKEAVDDIWARRAKIPRTAERMPSPPPPLDELEKELMPSSNDEYALLEGSRPNVEFSASSAAAPSPPAKKKVSFEAPREKLRSLQRASYYKEKMLKERKVKLNIDYIAKLVEGAVDRQDERMCVAVPFAIMDDSDTLKRLKDLHFGISTSPVQAECFCGVEAGKCPASLCGMPTDTCTPTRFQVSWKNS